MGIENRPWSEITQPEFDAHADGLFSVFDEKPVEIKVGQVWETDVGNRFVIESMSDGTATWIGSTADAGSLRVRIVTRWLTSISAGDRIPMDASTIRAGKPIGASASEWADSVVKAVSAFGTFEALRKAMAGETGHGKYTPTLRMFKDSPNHDRAMEAVRALVLAAGFGYFDGRAMVLPAQSP